MRRKDAYPDTETFHWYNANPKGRITGDCTFRAVCTALEKSWNDTVMEMAEMSCRTGYAINDSKGTDRYLKEQGWTKQKQPRKSDGTKYTGMEFCCMLNESGAEGSVIAHIGGHHIVCIKKHEGAYKVHDIWDSTYKCIGNYWVKKSG